MHFKIAYISQLETFQVSVQLSFFSPKSQGGLACVFPPPWCGRMGDKNFLIVPIFFLEHGWQHVAVILVQLNNLDFTVCEF